MNYTATLRDGSHVLIRPLTIEDKSAVSQLIESLSIETRFLFYHYVKCNITSEELEIYCNKGCNNTFVLGAEKTTPEGKQIVALARYDLLPDGCSAEISFVVSDKEQGKGLGTILLKQLIELSKKRGIKKLLSEMLNENVIMRDILLKYNPDLKQVVDSNSNMASLDLAD